MHATHGSDSFTMLRIRAANGKNGGPSPHLYPVNSRIQWLLKLLAMAIIVTTSVASAGDFVEIAGRKSTTQEETACTVRINHAGKAYAQPDCPNNELSANRRKRPREGGTTEDQDQHPRHHQDQGQAATRHRNFNKGGALTPPPKSDMVKVHVNPDPPTPRGRRRTSTMFRKPGFRFSNHWSSFLGPRGAPSITSLNSRKNSTPTLHNPPATPHPPPSDFPPPTPEIFEYKMAWTTYRAET